jgi:membrane fusion protein (multidrug efflux system)
MKAINCTALLIMAIVFTPFLSKGCSASKAAQVEEPAPAPPSEKISYVKLHKLVAQDLEESFTLPGTLEAWVNLQLAAEMSGPVSLVIPEEGARLKKDDIIIKIDSERLEAELARDRVELELQKKKLERRTLLVKRNLVSQQEYEDAKLATEQSAAALMLSQVALNKSTLKSPVKGILDRLSVDPGEYVREGTVVATMLQIDKLKALVDIPEKDVSFLAVGQDATVFVASVLDNNPQGIPGKIIHISYEADAATRTYRAKILVDNEKEILRSGMIVKVSFTRRVIKEAIAIPLSTLVDDNNSKVVYVAVDGRAVLRKIEISGIIGSQAIISDGLKVGDMLIVKGQHMISDGASVVEDSF